MSTSKGTAASTAATTTTSSGTRGVLIPLVLFGMYASFGAAWLGVVPLFQEIKSALAVDALAAGRLIGIVSLAKSFTPILAGIVAARVGLTATMRTAALLMALALLVPWLPGFPLWVAGRFLFGVGGAIWFALMGAVVVDAVNVAYRPAVNALNGVAVNTGAIIGLKLALPLAESFGFRAALTIFAVPIALFAVLLVAVGPLSQSAPRVVPIGAILQSYLSVLLEKTTWMVAIAFTGPLALYLVVNTWLPTHLQEAFAMPRPVASSWLVTMNLWGIPASLAVGFLLTRKIGPPRLHMIIGAVLLPVGIWMALQATTDGARHIWFAVAGIGMFWPVAPLVTALQRMPDMTAARVGMVLGTMGSVTYVVSSFAPDIVGQAAARGEPVAATLLVCCAFGLTPIVALLLPEQTPAR